MSESILIMTTAHWPGDPRLNRHVRYLEESGAAAHIETSNEGGTATRVRALLRATAAIQKADVDTVVLPDPELFVIGSITARLSGKRAAIDIHEDYPRVSAARSWVPVWARIPIRLLAAMNDWVGRRLANVVVVAAPELADHHSITVLNTPDPADFSSGAPASDHPVVTYVGDVTEARGAIQIAELAARLPQVQFLVIGRVDDALGQKMMQMVPDDNLELRGRLPHSEAWTAAAGAIAGLSLLEARPAYMKAVATKLWEYCASGIPPVVSDLPGQRAFVEQVDEDLVANGVDQLAAIIDALAQDPERLESLRKKCRALAERDWQRHRPDIALQRALTPRPMTRSDTPSEN